ncbi:MAG: mechanosensitive ion channel family protein [Flavobacteriales bacterium]|nr:mechanosensitive ion channel family protein [Flavobacteriales bacterium]MBK6943399.1 mechanosensitive ion channel family protein [Flavobacteriales bacterium]MBP9139864.1 mechanosensitive ion channel family protein [Flavobacteriales bacterium]HQV53352.1 mechanosensitive ion channel family protein [Flavobacteriales bacterium]HQX31515.1 mechanosensitive ion channel family protein [Flavobacteriales bacterium]
MKGTFLNNALELWLFGLSFAVGGWIAARLVYFILEQVLSKMASRTATKLDDILVGQLKEPIVLAVTLFGFYLGYNQLAFVPRVELWADRVFKVSLALTFTWLIARLLDALVQEYLLPRAERNETVVIESQLVPVVRSSIKLLVWGLGIVLAMNNAGYNVGALLAGIGIGGLALAMAAKDTVANVFGGITVFSDKPFKTGDRIRIEGHDGTVKEIGIRSTRIQTLDGPIVVVPNFKFNDTVLQNVTSEPSRKVKHDLGLIYDTAPSKIEEAIAILTQLVMDNQDVLLADHLASFTAFKDYSLNITFVYFIHNGADIFAVQTRIHLELMRRFAAASLEFAYPTAVELQSNYKPLSVSHSS